VVEQVTIEQIEELRRGGDEFLSETRQLGDATILVGKSGDLSFIEMQGQFTREVGQYLERVARSCPANIGLAFREIRRDPNSAVPTKFDSTIVPLLKRVRARCERRGFSFVLCSPPQELLDVFSLLGIQEEFTIIDDAGERQELAQRSRPGSFRQRKQRVRRTASEEESGGKSADAEPVERRIQWLGSSLKRTAHIEKELDSAAKCVKRFLPENAPSVLGYSIGFSYSSCEKVGGDFFDFVPLDDQSLGISIGDVTGHGLDAALVMGITKKLISVRAKDLSRQSPAEVLKQVNRDLSGDLNRKTFVTAIYGVLDLSSGVFRFARAGHEFPIVFRQGGNQKILESKGLALGMGNAKMFDTVIEEMAVRLDAGVHLLLVTDGLAECRNDKDALYSRERILFELGQREPNATTQDYLDRLLSKIRTFQNGRAQEDDMTAILVQRVEDGSNG